MMKLLEGSPDFSNVELLKDTNLAQMIEYESQRSIFSRHFIVKEPEPPPTFFAPQIEEVIPS